jgi:hypothetical protein
MQKILVSFLLFSIIFQSTPAEADTDTKNLDAQIDALSAYIQRTQITWKKTPPPLSHERTEEIIKNGTGWLVASQEESGHFAYEYIPYEDQYREDDNIVRQAGALYALGEVVRRSQTQNKETNQAIENAVSYFESLSPEHEYDGKTLRCITKNKNSKLCKLGATSLALIGILSYVEENPKKAAEYEELIEGYKTFILQAKKEGTGFRDQYTVGSGFRGDTESPFSNGEALLALVRYYQYNDDAEVKKVIDDSFVYLHKQPFDSSLYLWMMAALKDMNVLWPNATYTTYGKNFTFWRLSSIQAFHNSSHNYCPANEGFASAYSLLENTLAQSEANKLRTEIDFWNTKNSGLQIGASEELRFSVVDGKQQFNAIQNLTQSAGGFLTSDAVPTQRIDFTQHCVTAYVQTLVDIDTRSLSL